MAVKLITAYTGTRHILASNAANVGKAVYSSDSVILSDGGSLAETTNVGSKKMTIAAGILLFSGRFVEITSTDTDTLAFPSSDSLYRKIVTGIEYSKNTDSSSSDYLTETCVYKAYVSADCTSTIQAVGVSNDGIIVPTARTISASTTSAFLPLYETIVNKTSQISKKCLLGTMSSLMNLQKELDLDNRDGKLHNIDERLSSVEDDMSLDDDATGKLKSFKTDLETLKNACVTKLSKNLLSLNDGAVSQEYDENTFCLISFTGYPSRERKLRDKCLLLTIEKTSDHNIYGYSGPFPSAHISTYWYEIEREISSNSEVVYYAKIKQEYVRSGVVKVTVIEITTVTTNFGTQQVETGALGNGDTTTINTFSRNISTYNNDVFVQFYKVGVR